MKCLLTPPSSSSPTGSPSPPLSLNSLGSPDLMTFQSTPEEHHRRKERASQLFAIDRGNGMVTQLIPADELPYDLVGIPRVQGSGGVIVVGAMAQRGVHRMAPMNNAPVSRLKRIKAYKKILTNHLDSQSSSYLTRKVFSRCI
jgi:hypothetical protein